MNSIKYFSIYREFKKKHEKIIFFFFREPRCKFGRHSWRTMCFGIAAELCSDRPIQALTGPTLGTCQGRAPRQRQRSRSGRVRRPCLRNQPESGVPSQPTLGPQPRLHARTVPDQARVMQRHCQWQWGDGLGVLRECLAPVLGVVYIHGDCVIDGRGVQSVRCL